jgi:putative transposase
MVQILREADRGDVTGTAKKHGISDQTIYVWRKRFGAMTPDDTRRLKSLESENGKLKKLLADRLLEIDVLKEINAKNRERARTSAPGRVREEGNRPGRDVFGAATLRYRWRCKAEGPALRQDGVDVGGWVNVDAK